MHRLGHGTLRMPEAGTWEHRRREQVRLRHLRLEVARGDPVGEVQGGIAVVVVSPDQRGVVMQTAHSLPGSGGRDGSGASNQKPPRHRPEAAGLEPTLRCRG